MQKSDEPDFRPRACRNPDTRNSDNTTATGPSSSVLLSPNLGWSKCLLSVRLVGTFREILRGKSCSPVTRGNAPTDPFAVLPGPGVRDASCGTAGRVRQCDAPFACLPVGEWTPVGYLGVATRPRRQWAERSRSAPLHPYNAVAPPKGRPASRKNLPPDGHSYTYGEKSGSPGFSVAMLRAPRAQTARMQSASCVIPSPFGAAEWS